MKSLSTDVLLIRQGDIVTPYVANIDLSEEIWRKRIVQIFGVEYSNIGPCCEWLAVEDTIEGSFVGVSLLLFYPSLEKESIAGLKATNVLRDDLDGAVVLFRPTKNWKTVGGPCLPVAFLRGSAGQACYFISGALPEGDRILKIQIAGLT